MHYYQFNIKDYRKDTAHLSPIEHYVYRQLIDWYYLDELTDGIPKKTQLVLRRLGLVTENEPDLNNVLTDFFFEGENGWKHKRIERDIEDIRIRQKNHWGKNLTKAQRSEIQAARNAAKINATPKWLSKQHKLDISGLYAQRDKLTLSTGVRHEVDHIVPLRGVNVCGLHVPWNLQVIPAHENRIKSNSFGG